jgi:hypothetical protein
MLKSKTLPTGPKEVGKNIIWLRGTFYDVIMSLHPDPGKQVPTRVLNVVVSKKVGQGP